MSAIARAQTGFTPAQLQTIKRTVAADCNDTEFDLFLEACRSYRLDPFRRQISAIVFGAKARDQSKRKMAIIVNRDGLRVIAQRCGNYRPASEPAQIDYDATAVSATNPKGIVRAVVRLWQQDSRGDWFPVSGEAYWDEFVPVKDEWVEGPDGQRRPSGQKTVEGNWLKMPVVMITKCAEGQALRAGWPDEFGGVYVEEEVERAKIEETASETIRSYEEEERLRRIGGKDAIFFVDDGGTLDRVPLGKVVDHVIAYLRTAKPEDALLWQKRNTEGLKEFWARAPGDALELKKQIEAKVAPALAHAEAAARGAA